MSEPQPTSRPWAVFGDKPFSISIIAPAGDAELGNWMVAERIRWPVDAELIVRAVNVHDDFVELAQRVAEHFADTDARLGAMATALLAKASAA